MNAVDLRQRPRVEPLEETFAFKSSGYRVTFAVCGVSRHLGTDWYVCVYRRYGTPPRSRSGRRYELVAGPFRRRTDARTKAREFAGRRCLSHEDCAVHRTLGEECWRATEKRSNDSHR